MRKLLLLSTMLVLGLSTLQAQITIKPHLAGSFTSLSTNPDDWEETSPLGTLFGVGLQIGKKWYLEPALQWNNSSVKFKVNISNETVETKIKYNGFRIPVMVGYKFIGSGDFLNVRLFAGPSVLVNTSSEIQSDLPDVSSDVLADSNWGLNIGAGADVLFFYVELSYEAGLNSTFKEDIENWNDPKRNLFYITLGANIL